MFIFSQSSFIILVLTTVSTALPQSTNDHTSSSYNKIIDSNSSCDSNFLNITIILEQPFNGVFFAKEFSQECRSFGNSSRSLTLSLPTSGCGISLNSDDKSQTLYYTVSIILQQDKFLRQISDENKIVKCYLPNDSFRVKSRKMENTLKSLMGDVSRRKGRMKIDWNNNTNTVHNDNILAEALKAARAWMEILPVKHTRHSTAINVGEPVLLVVKSTLPVGIGWRVVECLAHDGLGDSSQILLDENGCPIDELLLPAMSAKPAKSIALMKHQEAVSKFAAFKFPDRDRLHLACNLQLCRNACPQVDCSSWNIGSINDNRLGRTLNEGSGGDILDSLKVFNSVEVKAPAIELQEDYVNFESNYGKYTSPFVNIPGDKTFCISPSNMALSFCLLGLVLLGAVFMATWSFIRARSGGHMPHYTRSLFSSSGISGYGGSKSLLEESPYMIRHSRNMNSYGRMY